MTMNVTLQTVEGLLCCFRLQGAMPLELIRKAALVDTNAVKHKKAKM